MNIFYKWGFYINNQLISIDANLNVSFEYYKELKELLKVYTPQNKGIARIGNQDRADGYIMIQDFKSPSVVYSFGLKDELPLEFELAEKGYEIFLYDNSVTAPANLTDNMHFFKEGLGEVYNPYGPLDTLKNYIYQNEHNIHNNMILKINLKGSEWDILNSIDSKTLNQFDQIVVEFHDLIKGCSDERKQLILNALRHLQETHQLIHLHANNSSRTIKIGNTIFADIMEASFAKKDKYETALNEDLSLPTIIDHANDVGRADLNMGKWNQPLTLDED